MTPAQLRSMKLYERIEWAAIHLEPVPTDKRIVWERPEGHIGIRCPTPEWMAMALHGWILPPVEDKAAVFTGPDGKVVNGHLLHTRTIGPMTEDEAIQYQVQLLPRQVWAEQANRPRWFVTDIAYLRTVDYRYREAWRMGFGCVEIDEDEKRRIRHRRAAFKAGASIRRLGEKVPWVMAEGGNVSQLVTRRNQLAGIIKSAPPALDIAAIPR
jgi:hypothetical protein